MKEVRFFGRIAMREHYDVDPEKEAVVGPMEENSSSETAAMLNTIEPHHKKEIGRFLKQKLEQIKNSVPSCVGESWESLQKGGRR